MNTRLIFGICLAAVSCAAFVGCENELESGKEYPVLEIGDATHVYRLDRVMQNNDDVKPYFSFFDGVSLSLSYRDGKPERLLFDDSGVPFRVTGENVKYDGILDTEWEIYSASSPYEVRVKGTDIVICYMDKDRNITFPFRLGAPSNRYEYRFVLADGTEADDER